MNMRSNNMRLKRRISGFMLVEALVSMALLATVLGLALSTLGRARRHAAINNDQLEVLHLARQHLEIVRYGRYVDLSSSTNTFTNTYANPTYTYVVSSVVSSNIFFGTNYNKDVTLTVTFVGALNQTTKVTLITSMASALHQ